MTVFAAATVAKVTASRWSVGTKDLNLLSTNRKRPKARGPFIYSLGNKTKQS